MSVELLDIAMSKMTTKIYPDNDNLPKKNLDDHVDDDHIVGVAEESDE